MRNPAPTKAVIPWTTVAVLVGLASPAFALQPQEPPPTRVNGLTAVAGYLVRDTHSNVQESVEIFIRPRQEIRLPNGSPWIEFVARRNVVGDSGEETTWANSQDCPALRNTLIWLTTLVAPRIEIPGISPSESSPDGRRPRTVVEDGLQTLVWGRGTQPDHIANTRVEIESNGGLVAQFGRAARDNLASCWRPEAG